MAAAIVKAIQQIPHLDLRQLVKMFNNALRVLIDEKQAAKASDARRLKSLIQREWSKREFPIFKASAACDHDYAGNCPDEGMLSFLGYHVGNDGQPQPLRRAILVEICEGELPPVCSQTYLAQWGAPRSPERYHKLVRTLIALAESESRKPQQNLKRAIGERIDDLRFLRDRYGLRFAYPLPAISGAAAASEASRRAQ
jgi:hypothetical protein